MKISSRKAVLLAATACAVLFSLNTLWASDRPEIVRFLTNENGDVADVETARALQALSPVIVTLITSVTDINELCHTFKSLINVRGNENAPIIAFFMDEVNAAQETILKGCTDRNVFFDSIDLEAYPVGFVPDPSKDYRQGHINRFWTTGIWLKDSLSPYDIVMRIDDDSCFSSVLPNVPGFSKINQVYSSQYFPGDIDLNIRRLEGMYEFVVNYIEQQNLIPFYTMLWTHVITTEEATGSIPNFQDSFEISRKSFMQSPEVSAFHYNLTDMPPYGYYTQGWNVDAERFLTAAIFGTKASIDIISLDGFVQKDLQRGRVHPRICHFE